MRLTLAEVRDEVANAIGVCTTDAKVVTYVNRAISRLLPKGKWVGTYQRYRVCVSDACLTWPRQIETIEAYAMCDEPGTVRGGWFEFLGNGPGMLDEDSGVGRMLVDRGVNPCFDDVKGTNKKLAVYADVTEAVGARILVRYRDENNNWVRTQDAGVWIDGEYITIGAAGAYVLSSKKINPPGVINVVKPATNGVIRLYEYDTVGAVYKALAYYEPDEKVPFYRRSLIPNLKSSTGGACAKVTVEVLAKMRFIPATGDNDFLLITSIPAIVEEVRAVLKFEKDLIAEGQAYEQKAVEYLDEQLRHHTGDGEVVQMRVDHPEVFGGAVENVI